MPPSVREVARRAGGREPCLCPKLRIFLMLSPTRLTAGASSQRGLTIGKILQYTTTISGLRRFVNAVFYADRIKTTGSLIK